MGLWNKNKKMEKSGELYGFEVNTPEELVFFMNCNFGNRGMIAQLYKNEFGAEFLDKAKEIALNQAMRYFRNIQDFGHSGYMPDEDIGKQFALIAEEIEKIKYYQRTLDSQPSK